MTNHWSDIANANLVLVMGGNAAEAHPCGFKWVTEAKAHNKATEMIRPKPTLGVHRRGNSRGEAGRFTTARITRPHAEGLLS